MKWWNILVLILTLTSCAGMISNRSYIEIMEDEPVDLFVPGQDFQAISGDVGEAYRSTREIKRRTPPTEAYQKHQAQEASLAQELSYLESIQNKRAMAQYLKHREKIGGISERIYFLKIASMNERDEYLRYRGIMGETPFYDDKEYQHAGEQSELLVGMSKDQVLNSLGRPIRRDVAGDPQFENERWAYLLEGQTKYIFFESGKVEGWTNTDD